jgi:hypothetical protein
MAYTPFTAIAIGSLNWGAPVNNAIINLDVANNEHTPADHELIAWNFAVGIVVGSTAPTSGTVIMQKVWLRQAATITNVCMGIGSAGVALTAGQNFAGLYDGAGNRLGVTADQSAVWNSAGFKQMPLVAPVAVAAGAYYVAVLSNAGTPPTLARGGIITSSFPNANLTATNAAYAIGPAGQTTLPLSITMASRTLTANSTWSGVS